MASGLPDWERLTRPKFGGARIESGTEIVPANSDTTLISIQGKGMIYGGFLWIAATSTQDDSFPNLVIDNRFVTNEPWGRMNMFELNKPHSTPFYLLKYDKINFLFSSAIGYGYTFEEGFEIRYTEQNGITLTVSTRIIFALV